MMFAFLDFIRLCAWVLWAVVAGFVGWVAPVFTPLGRWMVRGVRWVSWRAHLLRCRWVFARSIPREGRSVAPRSVLLAPQSPYHVEYLSRVVRWFGVHRDGRSRLYSALGFYWVRAQGVVASSFQIIPLWPVLRGARWLNAGPLFGVDDDTREVIQLGAHEVHSTVMPTNNYGVIGDQEMGKSGHVKRMAARRIEAGHRVREGGKARPGKVFWFDTKSNLAPSAEGVLVREGEAAQLARECGGTVFSFRRFGGLTLNVLDPRITRDVKNARKMVVGESATDTSTVIGQDSLLVAFVEELGQSKVNLRQHFALTAALDLAHRAVAPWGRNPILADVRDALRTPNPDAAKQMRLSVEELLEYGLDPALALNRAITGDLSGFFNGQTSDAIVFDAPFIDADMSELSSEGEVVTLIMAVLTAFLRNVWLRVDGSDKMLVVDEGWFLLSKPSIAVFFLRLYKLPRSLALHNVAIFHRMFDFDSLSRDAQALLMEVRWWSAFHLKRSSADDFTKMVGLSNAASQAIQALRMDHAVVSLGDLDPRRVYFPSSDEEYGWTYTRAAMEGAREGDLVKS